ncbi:hypothetical protein, partial [Pseudoflavonifractor sp. An85]|uniref:hypothetical protein n=1 Tax=Pseudoflavonifractor sp. An85 TaxID=1965661 RepID=UPI000B559258
KLGQYNGDKEFAYQQYLDNYNKLQSYLGNLQDVNNDEYQKYLDEQEQKRYEQEQQQALQKQKQEMAQAQVDGILQAGVMPSSSLIAASGYSQEYINAMLQYYRQKAAAAARSSSSGGSSSSKSSTTTTTSSGKFSSTAKLVSIPQYGEVSVADAQRLKAAGLVRLTGYDKNGNPMYVPTAKVNDKNIQLSR